MTVALLVALAGGVLSTAVNVLTVLPLGTVIRVALRELAPPATVDARTWDVFVGHSDQ